MISLKMGVKFATSLDMDAKLPQEVNAIRYRNAISGHISCKIDYFFQKLQILNRNYNHVMLRSK